MDYVETRQSGRGVVVKMSRPDCATDADEFLVLHIDTNVLFNHQIRPLDIRSNGSLQLTEDNHLFSEELITLRNLYSSNGRLISLKYYLSQNTETY